MKLKLDSEQTLRLEELRKTLAKVLPTGAAERAEFPTVQYGCPCGCTVNYYVTCATLCYLGCKGTAR